MSRLRRERCIVSHFGRVVKAWDLKSHGFARAGSNPAGDASFAFIERLVVIIISWNEFYIVSQILNWLKPAVIFIKWWFYYIYSYYGYA